MVGLRVVGLVGQILNKKFYSTFASEPPTHPPNVEKKQKNMFFTLLTATNYCHTPLSPPNYARVVADAGGGWYQ